MGRNISCFFPKRYIQIYLSFFVLYTYIHMAESLWHSNSKCLWGVHFKVGENNSCFFKKCIYKYISPFSFYIRIYIWLSLFGTPIANACGECISKWGEIFHIFSNKCTCTYIFPFFVLYTYIHNIIVCQME